MPPNKYGMSANGSKLEKAVGQMLYLREKAGEILHVKEQARVRICCREETCAHKSTIAYVADFSFLIAKTLELCFAEAKGFETETWRVKRRLWMHYGKGPLEIWKGNHNKFYLAETIYPVGLS